jgi:hypothetical protein
VRRSTIVQKWTESTSCSKETIFDGYKSPLNSNSVFVIIVYIIKVRFLCGGKNKKASSIF